MSHSRIHVEVCDGAKPGMVLLHGVGRNGSDFRPLLPWLRDRRLHLWDHRGHGRSDRSADGYRVIDYAADVVDRLQDDEFDQIDLYGHSLGALTAVRVAAQLPGKVRSLVLEDPPSPEFLADLKSSPYFYSFTAMRQLAGHRGDVETIASQLADVRLGPTPDAVRLGDIRDAAALRFSARCLQSVDPAVFDPLLAGQWFHEYDFYATLAEVRCPTLLLHGEVEQGGMLSADAVARMQQALTSATVVPFAGAGHLLHWQRLDETVRVVLSFLESL